MRAVQVAKAGGPFELVERAVPEPAAGEVRIRVEACGICHSDAIVRAGAYPGLTLPRVPGHEIAGRVDAVGAGVAGWKPGDRVGVGWHGGHCFRCAACRKGWFINCERARITGITFDGGYAEYVVVPQEAVLLFQAEDGIRVPLVTGVQTCALPISRPRSVSPSGRGSAPPGDGRHPWR